MMQLTVVCSTPADNSRFLANKGFVAIPGRRQTKWDYVPGPPHCPFQHQQCDVIVEPDTAELRMRVHVYHLVRLW